MPRRPAIPGLDRRLQILEAALQVFAEQTFDRASTKEIADRAGVTQGLIYFYFPSKEELFLAAYDHFAKHTLDALDFTEEIESSEPPDRVFRRIIARIMDVMCDPMGIQLMRITMQTMSAGEALKARVEAGCPSPHQRIGEVARHIAPALRDYLSAQIARGTMRAINADLAAQMLTSALVSTMVRRAKGDDAIATLSQDMLTDTVVDIFLHGALASQTTN